MCATVCPSQALFFGTREEIEQLRPMSAPMNRFRFGAQVISTRVFMMVPRSEETSRPWALDVTAAMEESAGERALPLPIYTGSDSIPQALPADPVDPFAEMETGLGDGP